MLELVSSNAIKPHLVLKRIDAVQYSLAFWEVVFGEWTAVVLHPCVVSPIFLAFVQHRSELIYGNNGWRRKDVVYFSTLSFQVLINTCRFLRYVAEVMISCICRSMWIQRSSALAFEARADWNKFWAAADKACWVVLEALRSKSVRHVITRNCPYLSFLHNKYFEICWLATFNYLLSSCIVMFCALFLHMQTALLQINTLRSVLPTNGTAIRRQWNTQITQPLVQRPTIRRWIKSSTVIIIFFFARCNSFSILLLQKLLFCVLLDILSLFSHSYSYRYPFLHSLLFPLSLWQHTWLSQKSPNSLRFSAPVARIRQAFAARNWMHWWLQTIWLQESCVASKSSRPSCWTASCRILGCV